MKDEKVENVLGKYLPKKYNIMNCAASGRHKGDESMEIERESMADK